MLQCVGNNAHPECTHAINACAHCSLDPRQAHGNTLKQIGQCFKGVLDEGLIIDAKGPLSLDCHCDDDFTVDHNKKDSNDPGSVWSWTGFVITFGSVPILWKSKVQTEITLSTMESEHIALSTAMRSLVHLRASLFEIDEVVKLDLSSRMSTISAIFEDHQTCQILATTDPPCLTPHSESLAIKCHWFRLHPSEDSIIIKSAPSAEQKRRRTHQATCPSQVSGILQDHLWMLTN